MEFLKSLNWVDLFLVVLAVRIVYSSIKAGFVTEFLKTFAVFIVAVLAFHYYTKLAEVFGRFVGLTQPVLEVLVFAVIWLIGLIIMKFVRDGIFIVFTIQTISVVDRWGAAVISVARFGLTASMILFILLLTDQSYMERMTRSSFTQKYVLYIAPEVYQRTVDGFVAKLASNQKVNPAVLDELNETGKK
jgi:uncharacterized membrane protein required for colicin V production